VTTPDPVLAGYTADAAALIAPFEAIVSASLFAPVEPYLPAPPGRVLDIGAGTGRDAAWLVSLGFDVVAVEPVTGLLQAGYRLCHLVTGVPSHQQGDGRNGVTWDWLVYARE
jgi:protein-L-isoaspartate O-methyltransferase